MKNPASLLFALIIVLAALPSHAADLFFSPEGDRTIRVDRSIPGSIADVWRAWTTSEGIRAFLETPATVELRPAGKFEILFQPDSPEGQRGSEGCTVLSYLDKRMLSFTWNAPPLFPDVRNGPHKTIVVLEFFPTGAKSTRVVLTHHGWPDAAHTTEQWDKAYEYFEKAWPNVLTALNEYFFKKDGFDPAKLPSAGDPSLDPKNGYLYTFVELKRPDLIKTMTDEEGKQFGEHAEHIKRLAHEGTVIFAGPCRDMKGPAVVILDVRTESEARALMESDPAVKHGLMKAELHPVRLSFVRWRD